MNKWVQFGATLAAAGAITTGGVVAVDRQIDPYQDQGTHHELAIKSDIPQGERVEISKTRAEITIKGWNDEYAITVAPQNPQLGFGGLERPFNGQPSRPLLSKRMEWKDGDVTAFIEPKDGTQNEFDIDFMLDAPPDTSVFTYKIEGADEFDFLYQPELTPEEIAEGASRPENVVGSYAVYHKTKANHRSGSTNYATGKVLHIYRPKVIDTNNNETWAELNYNDGILSVTVPNDFLNNAIYPLRVDPTFGYSTAGATPLSRTSSNTSRANIFVASQYTASSGDTVTQFSVSARCTVSGTGTMEMSYYNTTGGVGASPITRQTTAQTITINQTTQQWFNSATISSSMTASTIYETAIGNWAQGTCTALQIFTDAGVTNDDQSHAAGALPASWSSGGGSNTKWSIYTTYTASGGGSTTTTVPGIIWFDE